MLQLATLKWGIYLTTIEELKKQKDTLKIVEGVARLSSMYELQNTELKKAYTQQEMQQIKNVFELSKYYKGTFGTGYPFYAVGEDMTYDLPVILEQLRYNNELIEQCRKQDTRLWACLNCLEENVDDFPNLKIYCKPCADLSNELKPRKVINRMPDLDIWCVAEKRTTKKICGELSSLLENTTLTTSDVDPLQTFEDFKEIVLAMQSGKMPTKHLPLDIHVVEEGILNNLIEKVPDSINTGNLELSIYPYSLRKTWDYESEGYNFVHDFLVSFSDLGLPKKTQKKLYESRKKLAERYSPEELYAVLMEIASDSTKRRYETEQLQEVFKEKVKKWKR